MAISLVTHPSYTSELQSLVDPLRLLQSFDYSFYDQMEFSPSTNSQNGNQENSTNHRNFLVASQPQAATNANNYQNYDQVIDFVDSPPNSKDAWQNDYPKQNNNHGPNIIDIQTLHGPNPSRKRRMDWESSLDINPSNSDSSGTSDAKIPNIGVKDREKKKTSGRGSWADDIDFDLNGEFGNNGYLNNEAFLSLSSALTVLKQEIPSPSGDARKAPRSPHEVSNKVILIDDKEKRQPRPNSANGNDCNKPSNHQQPIDSNRPNSNLQNPQIGADQQATSPHKPPQANPNGDVVGGFQQMLQPNSFENNSAKNSPCHSDSTGSKGDTLSDDYKFQYVLAAATSIATKCNEETLTYLNQGQSYEIKLKKIGDLSPYRGKVLKSIIKICFHERRLQYMEREQMQQWQASRPGERIIEVDVPLSYGLCHVSQPLNPNLLNTVEVLWDPMKEVGVYIKVNCISTEFTPKKHGGEKGVPFRIQIETYLDSTDTVAKPIHAAACQIKVFKLKGADRKHKQDREKIQKRPPSEQEKYQPSYECTILNDIPSESIMPQGCYSPEYIKPTVSPLMPNSPVHMPKYEGMISFVSNPSPVAINSVTSTNANYKLMDQNLVSPQQVEMEEYSAAITKESTPGQVAQWMTFHRLNSYIATFAHFSGSDILRMSKEDLIQICGLADGIRMFNTLHAKAITPRLTFYVSLDGSSYHAIYLVANTTKELVQKLFKLPGFYEQCSSSATTNGADGNVYQGWGMQSKYSGSGSNLYDASKLAIYINGPSGIHVLVTDEVLNNIKDDSLFALEIQNGKVLMKAIYKNENN